MSYGKKWGIPLILGGRPFLADVMVEKDTSSLANNEYLLPLSRLTSQMKNPVTTEPTTSLPLLNYTMSHLGSREEMLG